MLLYFMNHDHNNNVVAVVDCFPLLFLLLPCLQAFLLPLALTCSDMLRLRSHMRFSFFDPLLRLKLSILVSLLSEEEVSEEIRPFHRWRRC